MKSILVFSSVLFISIAALFQTNNVVVTSSLPNYSKPGESVDLEIVVSKGSLGGFSKFQMMLPEGFEAEAVDVKGGTFSFVDKKLKVIWVSLPSDPKFSLNFKLKIASGASGSIPLDGSFSFIQNGERSDASFSTQIFVSKDKPADLPSQVTSSKPTVAKIEPSEEEKSAEEKNLAEDNASFGFFREISNKKMEPKESVTVKLLVDKKMISGFGKITEVIPNGFKAKEIESNGAIFSVLNNEVRFLWMTLPATETFEVSYELIANDKEGEHSIKGSFSYVENSKTRLNSTSATNFSVVKPAEVVAVAPSKPEVKNNDEPKTSSTETEAVEKTSGDEETMASTESSAGTEEKSGTEETSKSESGASNETASAASEASETAELTNGEVSYRVQICATRKSVDKQHFVKYNQVSETIYADMHEGWHKFTVGAFGVYGDARNHRETVKEENKIKGPFVTAYNAGARITVQEALMISKQQWVP